MNTAEQLQQKHTQQKQTQHEQTQQKGVNPADLERLKSLRYIDDDFFTVCLEDNFEAVELILRIILGKNIKIKSIRVQEVLKNLRGRSAILDVHAIDTDDREMNIEIQRNDKGADAKRARYFKQDKEGVKSMSKLLEDMVNEATKENARETAKRMIMKGKMSLEDIADCVQILSIDELKEIEAEVMSLA